MKTLINKFIEDENGATAIEYGLIAALISVAIVATVRSVGSSLDSTFTNVNSELQ